MLLYITGFMGSGKTTLFKRWTLEEESFKGFSFDFDCELARRLGIDPHGLGDWIRREGIENFRLQERQLLCETLQKENGLFSLGGGALDDWAVREIRKKGGLLIWVKTSSSLCWERVKRDDNRPLAQKGKDEFFALYRKRCLFYKKADYEIRGEESFPSFEQFCKKHRVELKIDEFHCHKA